MVRAYVGDPKVLTGSGKTLSALCDLKRYVEKTYNQEYKYKIVSNIPFQFSFNVIERRGILFRLAKVTYEAECITDKTDYIKAMCTRTNTIFFLDEASVWLNQYDWKIIPDELYDRLNQLRKDNIHLVYTAQQFDYVAPRLRDHTNPIYECCPFPRPDIDSFAPPPVPIWITQQVRTPAYFAKLNSILGNKELMERYTYKTKRIFYSELKRTMPAFNTKQKIYDSGSNLEKIAGSSETVDRVMPVESTDYSRTGDHTFTKENLQGNHFKLP